MILKNRPRIFATNLRRMEDGAFVYSWSIRGWFLGAAKVNALRELQSAGGEELHPFFGWTLMPSILDKAFKGEL